AQGLDAGVPESGSVLRLGSRSFVVLLPNVAKSLEPESVRERLLADLRESVRGMDGPQLAIAGIGVAALTSDAEDARVLLGRAYAASSAAGAGPTEAPAPEVD